jgi:hypothetical protein
MSDSINPFETEDKQFDTVDAYLDRLQSDLEEKGYDIEWGDHHEDSVEVVYEGSVLEELRVPTNLEVVNKQVGPITGYDMMLDAVESALYYDEEDGNLPFMEN